MSLTSANTSSATSFFAQLELARSFADTIPFGRAYFYVGRAAG
jgi:hypothetical protein